MRVAGIDPGTIQTGIGILEQSESGKFVLIHAETIKINAEKPLVKRLHEIYNRLRESLKIYKPDVVAIENIFFSKDFKAAVKIGEARAVAILAAVEMSIPVEEYPPARIKQAICGSGRAQKTQIQFMIKQLLRLKEEPSPDSADALAVAICHFHMSRWVLKKAEALANIVNL